MKEKTPPPPPSAKSVPLPPEPRPLGPPPPPVRREVVPKHTEDQVLYVDNGMHVAAPSAVDLEVSVLGAIIVDEKALEFIPKLNSDVFYLHKHKVIFNAIQNIYNEKGKIDILTVSEELKRMNQLITAGGDYYVIKCATGINSSAHLDYHIKIILQKYILRMMIMNSRKTMYDCLHENPDVFKILENTSLMLDKVDNVINLQKSNVDSLDPIDQLRKKVQDRALGIVAGVPIGFSEFDDWCDGFQNRELITIAARPGMGKTSVMLSATKHAAIDKGIPTAVFSLEMAKIDLFYRYASNLTRIPYTKIKSGNLNKEELEKVTHAIEYLKKSDLHIFDTSDHKNFFEKIVKKIRELVAIGVKSVWIDYVQLMKLATKLTNRTAEINEITRDLKALANELNIPIIIFAQLNRAVEGRINKMPLLSDLKESGSIEEDSDTVIFLLRDAYYQEKNGVVELPPRIVGETKFNIAKGRNIGTRLLIGYLDFFHYTFLSLSDYENSLTFATESKKLGENEQK